jgi:ATP-dependent RNA helicase DeaD
LAFLTTNPSLARALAERDYNDPTPVQTAVLESAAEDRDLLVSAQTGSGKTVAYGLAIGATLLGEAEFFGRPGAPVALIVAPTRELALQVQREITWLYQYAQARVVSCVGGMDPRQERRLLVDGVHVVVGTPGRLRDHLERGALDVSGVKALVIDEADEMLDLGFRDDLEFILQTTPPERRTLLFSATLPRSIITLAKHYQRDAFRIQTSGDERGHADIEYRAVRIAAQDVDNAVINVLRYVEPPSALVFCNTRESVRRLQANLSERGFSVVALSGELSQSERNQALKALREGKARVCVATDVAARGIDLPQLGLVIHAELPRDAEVLQHRSGRTGRAGRKGISILLVTPAGRRRATQLLASARINAEWQDAPTPEAIRKLDQQRFLQNAVLNGFAREDESAFAKALLANSSAENLAIALVRLYRAQLPAAEDLADPAMAHDRAASRQEPRGKRDRHEKAGPRETFDPRPAPGKADRDAQKSGPRTPMKSAWFRIDIGRQKRADPKWLVPVICRKGGVTKREIGAIRVFDDETRFEIDERVAQRFAESVRNAGPSDGRIEPSSAPTDARNAAPQRETPPEETRPKQAPSSGAWNKRPAGDRPQASEGDPIFTGQRKPKPERSAEPNFAGKKKPGREKSGGEKARAEKASGRFAGKPGAKWPKKAKKPK